MTSERQIVYRSLFELDGDEAWKLLEFISMIPDYVIKRDSNDELKNLINYYNTSSKVKLGLDFTLLTSVHHLDCTKAIDKLQDDYPHFVMRFYDIQGKKKKNKSDHFIIIGKIRYQDYKNIIDYLFPEIIKKLDKYISDLPGNWEYVYKMIVSRYTMGSNDIMIHINNEYKESTIVVKDVTTIFFN